MFGATFAKGAIDNYVPIGHCCNASHFVRHKNNCGVLGQLSDYII